MAVFSNMIVTNSGKTMYAKSIAGKTIKFTEARVGNGKPEGATEGLTSLVSEGTTAAITAINVTDGKALVVVEVSNEMFAEALSITEIGLFAKVINEDGTEEAEALYAYCYAVEGMDTIPPITNGHVDWIMQLELYISNAAGETTGQGVGTWVSELAAHKEYAEATYAKKADVTTTHVSTSAPTSSDGEDGDVWYVYQ